jgi:hypothetical protein
VQVGGLDIPAILAPARLVGVYDAIAASAKFGERRRLALPDKPVTKLLDNGTTLPSVRRLVDLARERAGASG